MYIYLPTYFVYIKGGFFLALFRPFLIFLFLFVITIFSNIKFHFFIFRVSFLSFRTPVRKILERSDTGTPF